MSEKHSMEDWYNQKSIFITGGTGFMGKVLIEKMLRSLTGIDKIYVLIRPKRGLSPTQRIEALENLPLFRKLMAENPGVIKKIIPIVGDIGDENLGISVHDMSLLVNEVSIVFHLGATLRLEANIADAVKLNTAGTLCLLQMCKQFKKLKAFVHVSTAFCHADISILEEQTYPPTHNPYEMIEICKTKSNDYIAAMEPSLLRTHFNSYIFSKRLAEAIVDDMKDNIPVVIVRPSIVLPTMVDPFPGWVDSLNGPMGVIIASGKGVMRTMYCKEDSYLKGMPVDVAANGFIRIAYLRGTESTSDETPVYNLTGGNLITYKEVLDTGKRIIFQYPYEWTLWFPDGTTTTNRLMHNLTILFFHYLPAYFIDFLLLIFMQERFMIRVQNKISLGLKLLEYFTGRDWYMINRKVLCLEKGMSKEEAKKFPIVSCMQTDLIEYMGYCLVGSRTYCMKENPKSLPFCRIYIRFLYCLHWLVRILFYYYLAKGSLYILGNFHKLSSYMP